MDDPRTLVCIDLWRRVLTQAVSDALGLTACPAYGSVKYERGMARAWVLGNSADFRLVCVLAGLDPDYMHEKLVALFGLPHPELTALIETTAMRRGPNTLPQRQNFHRDRQPDHRLDPLNRPA